MGTDIPLAVLSRRSQILPNYFKQLFAQVTNPPIDPIREKIVMSTESLLGSELNLLEESPEHARLLRLKSPTLGNADLARIRAAASARASGPRPSRLLFERSQGEAGLEPALDRLCAEASAGRRTGGDDPDPLGPGSRRGPGPHSRAAGHGGRAPSPDPRRASARGAGWWSRRARRARSTTSPS